MTLTFPERHTVVSRSDGTLDGSVVRVRFPNDYGVSVGQSRDSYGGTEGKWELAVLAFNRDGFTIVEDVYGWLTPEDVTAHATRVSEL